METLLAAFQDMFLQKPYKHRIANQGDTVASRLYDDLYALGFAKTFVKGVDENRLGINVGNQVKGKRSRRGDGTFGKLIPGEVLDLTDSTVPRGIIASLQIGAEVKTMSTKMLAQVDRVINDLQGQAATFRKLNSACITIGLVGVNYAETYLGLEGERTFQAKYPPLRDAPEVMRRLKELVAPHFDELIVLRFAATNVAPYPFGWVDQGDTAQLYKAALVRISDEYERRFG